MLGADPDSLRLSTDFRPGAPCFGAGDYIALRPGLRIEFPVGPAFTVVSWDAAKPEARVKVGEQERTVIGDQVQTAAGVRVSIKDGALRLE